MASNVGFEAIDLPANPDTDVSKVNELVNSLSLRVAEVTGLWGYWHGWKRDIVHPDKTIKDIGMKYGRDLIDLSRKFGQMTEINLITRAEVLRHQTYERLYKQAIVSVEELARYAEDRGVTLLLETVNRLEISPYVSMLNRTEQALQLLRDVNSEALGILFDTVHSSIEDESIVEAIYACRGVLKHVHFAESNRSPPGFGHIDFKEVIRALKSIGYDGFLSLEVSPPPTERQLRLSLDYLTSLIPL
jgi:sugar phosphate isomerase/epimerase